MTQYSYTQYTSDDADMDVPGSVDPTKAPEHWAGRAVNNFCRAIGSAVRNLGDRTLFAPPDGGSQQAGTLARQNFNNVTLTGGTAELVRGVCPIATTIDWFASLQNLIDNYNTLFFWGWIFADGRTVVNPYTGFGVTAPNLIGRYKYMDSNASFFGAASNLTSVAGAHGHGFATGTTQLGAGNLPPITVTLTKDQVQAGSGFLRVLSATATYVGTADHAHSIAADGDHQHVVTLSPLSVGVIPLIRLY